MPRQRERQREQRVLDAAQPPIPPEQATTITTTTIIAAAIHISLQPWRLSNNISSSNINNACNSSITNVLPGHRPLCCRHRPATTCNRQQQHRHHHLHYCPHHLLLLMVKLERRRLRSLPAPCIIMRHWWHHRIPCKMNGIQLLPHHMAVDMPSISSMPKCCWINSVLSKSLT